MSEDVMFVRLPGGDVVRRPVAYRQCMTDMSGKKRLIQEEPELADGEVIVRTFGDPIPTVIKIK